MPRRSAILLASLALLTSIASGCSGDDEKKTAAPQPFIETELALEQGQAHLEAGDFQQALDIYDAALASGNQSADIWALRANALTLLKRFDEAVADYTTSLEKEERAQTYFWRGEAYTWIDEHDKAENDYTRALGLEPDFLEAQAGRGNVFLFAKQDYGRAIVDYSEVLRRSPNDCNSLSGRYKALIAAGREAEALPDKQAWESICAQPE
ncbi:MAG: tetratricopeptide repeat protein [bacterium]|nr:tetratricopeptide repeat protein [bacterium]